MSAIPEKSRGLVKARDRYLCVRCGCRGGEWHHRRSRSVVDACTHCPCNGILLCKTCHEWVHKNPFLARASGWIVSKYQTPIEQEVQTVSGPMVLDHDGGFAFTASPWERRRFT